MGLVSHAQSEMKRVGLYDKDADYDGDIAKSVEELMKVFAAQGHSGGSAMRTLEIFFALARFKTLSPITSDPKEWMEIGTGVWQSTRDASYFSPNNGKDFYTINAPSGFWKWIKWRLTDFRLWKKSLSSLRAVQR